MEAIGGVTLDMLAEIMTKFGEVRLQYGAAQEQQRMSEYLATLGLTFESYSMAHNAWIERMRADPTRQLEADYHMRVARCSNKLHYGNAPDHRSEVREGVTFDRYVQLCVEMRKPGVDAEAAIRAQGLTDMAQWQRANMAWTQAMAEDTSMVLTSQFGELYSKYAGPAFEQSMRDQTAAALASAPSGNSNVQSPPAREETIEELIAKLGAPELAVRFKAARWLAHRWYLGHEADPSLDRALVCIPVLLETVERHDVTQAGLASDAASKLIELRQFNDDVRGALTRCLNRAHEKLATMNLAFPSIPNHEAIQRMTLRSQIDEHEALIRDLTLELSRWDDSVRENAERANEARANAARSFSPTRGGTPRKSGSGAAKAIPLVMLLGVGGILGYVFLLKGKAAIPALPGLDVSAAPTSVPAPAPLGGRDHAKAASLPATPAPIQSAASVTSAAVHPAAAHKAKPTH